MKKVLVTGATGFIGRHCLVPLLESSFQVHATCKRRIVEHVEVHWHHVDLMNAEQISTLLATLRPTHLLHFAWVTTPGEYTSSPQNLQWVSASLHLLREFAAHGGQRVVMAGTCAEYDWDCGYCCEAKTAPAPATLYGACKGALRSILQSFSDEVQVSSARGRVFLLYGPHEHPERLVASVIRKLLADQQAGCTSGTQIRDFMYVQDVAEAFVALLNSDLHGAVNIASGEPVTIKEVLQTIGETLGRPHLLALGAVPTRKNEPPVLLADIRRLSSELNWKPRYDLKSGLENTIRWWEQYS